MTSTEYIERCQIVSKVRKGVLKRPIPKLMPKQCVFEIDKIKYYPLGYQLTFRNGRKIYTAILGELETGAERYIDLEKLCKSFS